MVDLEGFEPPPYTLQMCCTTVVTTGPSGRKEIQFEAIDKLL